MKNIVDLNFGYSDAENYKRRENKEFFNRIFIRNQYLDLLCGPQTCFLMGEKGTGKTAYAVFCSNNEYKSTRSSVRYVRETDYQRFMTLKLKGLLDLSDYASIWKVILYLLLSQQVIECEGGASFLKRFTKMSSLQNAIDEYYSKAFNPEILQALQFATESKIAAELVAKYAHASGETKDTVSFSENRFQLNLFYLQKAFVAALGQLRLSKSHILFVDGIDVRPADVPFREYLTCVRGLASAIWEVNNDTFSTFKDRGGRLRVVLLVRPDIFGELGLQNLNTKARENAVYLDWRTEDKAYRTSELFQVVSKLVSVQQEPTIPPPGKAWDHYFPEQLHNSFVDLLRISYFRPRDLLTALTILREVTLEKDPHKTRFTPSDLANPTFRKKIFRLPAGRNKRPPCILL